MITASVIYLNEPQDAHLIFVLSEKVFLKYTANLQENTHAEVGFQ